MNASEMQEWARMLHSSFSFGTQTTPKRAYFQINQNQFSVHVSVVKTCFPYLEKYLILCSQIRSCLGYFSFVYFKDFLVKSGNFEVSIESLVVVRKIQAEQLKLSLKTFDYMLVYRLHWFRNCFMWGRTLFQLLALIECLSGCSR